MGDACPIPVVKAKNAIKELGGAGEVEVLVDNEIAVQNLTKMAVQKGYGIRSEKLEEGKYQVVYTIGGDAAPQAETPDETPVCRPDQRGNTVIAVTSATMGVGDDDLGGVLMKGFFYALTQQDALPGTILFYNGGARLTCGQTPIVEDLKSLEAQGVEIMTCGTCLNHYGLTEQLSVGSVTNMYAIVEKLMQAGTVIRP
jgi:selenium metabolism protein YedF